MGILLLVLLIGVPILELYVFVQVAGAIGFWWALLAVIAISVVGLWLVKVSGLSAMRRGAQAVDEGRTPTKELLDGALLLLAGGLLLFPGFVTGVCGLLLLLPPVRALIRPLLARWWGRGRATGRVQVIEATYRGPEAGSGWGPDRGGPVADSGAEGPIRGELLPPPDDPRR